ncbi:predicted transcriptional regulators [Clostridium sp. CAG:590]|nr:predicted transcriptional regulators [Clostridium sp. CAG:590]
MKINIQSKGGIPIYTQISNQIKEAILTGQLRKGEALPSIRGLSADLKISVITTKKAYEELEQEEMIYSVPGKGFFVDDPDLDYLAEKRTVTIEEELAGWIAKAKATGLGKEEVYDMIEILWEDTDD